MYNDNDDDDDDDADGAIWMTTKISSIQTNPTPTLLTPHTHPPMLLQNI